MSLNKKRILCLDDDKSIHRIIGSVASSTGAIYKGLLDDETLAEALIDFCPHVFLLDIRLKDKFSNSILDNPEIQKLLVDTEVIIISSSKSVSDYKKFKGLPISAFYMKPIHVEKITKKIKDCIAMSPEKFDYQFLESSKVQCHIALDLYAVGENKLVVDGPLKLDFDNNIKFEHLELDLIDKDYLRFRFNDSTYLGSGIYRNELYISGTISRDIDEILKLRRRYAIAI